MNNEQKDPTARRRALMEVLSKTLVDLMAERLTPAADSEATREQSASPPQAQA